MEKLFLSTDKFSGEIEKQVDTLKVSYIEAILQLCEDKDVEVEVVKKYINKNIKGKLEAEARELNYLPYVNQLPL